MRGFEQGEGAHRRLSLRHANVASQHSFHPVTNWSLHPLAPRPGLHSAHTMASCAAMDGKKGSAEPVLACMPCAVDDACCANA